MKIILIRHGRTLGNQERRYVGRTDEALSGNGKKELCEKVDGGAYPSVDRLIISPMIRCRQTAEIIFGKEMVQNAIVEPELREMDFGYFEYKNYEELNGDTRYQAYLDSGGFRDFPDGETLQGFENRCVNGFLAAIGKLNGTDCYADKESICQIENDFTVGMVAHGGSIMAVMNRLCTTKKTYYDWMLDNGAFYICEWDGERLCLQNA